MSCGSFLENTASPQLPQSSLPHRSVDIVYPHYGAEPSAGRHTGKNEYNLSVHAFLRFSFGLSTFTLPEFAWTSFPLPIKVATWVIYNSEIDIYCQRKIEAIILSVEINFSNWLQNEIDKRGWSWNKLAKRAGLSSGTIYNIRDGIRGGRKGIIMGDRKRIAAPRRYRLSSGRFSAA
jgi:hypothetical protein